MEEENKNSFWHKVLSVGSSVFLGLAVVICIYVLSQVFSQGYVEFAGKSLFRVATGSMEPEIQVGALLMSEQTEIESIELGDIICFRSRESYQLGMIITHRVTAVLSDGDGGVLLETRGDANLSVDPHYVRADNLIGKVIWYSREGDILATVVSVLTDKIGFLACIVFPVLLVSTFILQSCVKNIRQEMQEAIAELEQRVENAEAAIFTQEEYAAMVERIRKELLEELRQGANHEVSEAQPEEKTE